MPIKKTKALLVGINDYQPVGPGGPDLHGCVNDVRDMANTLVISGYNPASIRILTDNRATKHNILAGLTWLLTGAKKGDSIVFYYSGHGSTITDLSGDEPDGKDEIICPHDWPNYISDDDFKKIFKELTPGVNLEVIFDCCHSGTGTRDLMLPVAGEPHPNTLTARFIQPPFDDHFYDDFKVEYKRPKKKLFAKHTGNKQLSLVPGLNHVLWAACKENQLSNETNIGGNVRGIFTYNYCSILRACSGTIERKKLDALLSAALSRYGYNQTPQLEATSTEATQLIFA